MNNWDFINLTLLEFGCS